MNIETTNSELIKVNEKIIESLQNCQVNNESDNTDSVKRMDLQKHLICKQCDKEFINSEHLKIHMNSDHPRKYSCQTCEIKVSSL